MLEIIALICLWRVNGANAAARGKSRRKYQFLTLAIWFGMEFIGVSTGMALGLVFAPNVNSFMIGYVSGIIGAVIGGIVSYKIAKSGPVIEDATQNKVSKPFEWNSAPGSYTFNDQNINGGELLNAPATIRIVEELGGYGGKQTYYYMNGQPVCALYPGMEAVLKTRYVRNIVTIASPVCDKNDTLHSVRFIAADDGTVEIHASAGEFIPELFKNYASN